MTTSSAKNGIRPSTEDFWSCLMSTTAQSPPAEHPADPVDDTAPTRRDRSTPTLEPLLRRLHFYVGVFVAPFLVVAALTGLAYTVTPQLDEIAYGDHLHVAAVGTSTVPLADQLDAARAVVPDGTVVTVSPPAAADATTKVVFSVPDLGENTRTVYVDPYTGRLRGTLTTWFGSTPLTTWLDELHRTLLLGEFGSIYTEIAASWLWVLVLGGLALWWRRQRGRRRVRRMIRPDLAANAGVRRTRGWHASTGVWIAIVLLILSATGLTWSTYAGARFDLVQEAFDSTKAVPDTTLAATAHTGGDAEADLSNVDSVLAVARKQGLSGPVDITPAAAGEAWTVTQADNVWPVRYDAVAVDPNTFTVTDHVHWSDQPLLAQLSTLGVQAHMGVLFGLANQLVLAVTAIALLCMIFWGYRMWWQRRPTRADRRRPLGTPPARSTWRNLPSVPLAIGVVVMVALGWALPLLGLSLVAFLVIDLLTGLVIRRRTRQGAVNRVEEVAR
jgi:uncharacterized iron-regulated membrane protein